MYEGAKTKCLHIMKMILREEAMFQCSSRGTSGFSSQSVICHCILGFSREFREGLPMVFLLADELVLIIDTEELLLEE